MGNENHNESKEIASLRHETITMLEQAGEMFRTAFDGLMKNDIAIINRVLKDEMKVTDKYNDLTALAVEISKGDLSDHAKKSVLDLVDIVSFTEQIADSCVNIVEQIEYKIREKLLWSDTAVREYQDLHSKIGKMLSDTVNVMKAEGGKVAEKIVKNKPAIDALVDQYRASHIERSAQGICDEWARIRYLDMLNITQTVAYDCIEIAGKLV